jgi:thioredoxin 2
MRRHQSNSPGPTGSAGQVRYVPPTAIRGESGHADTAAFERHIARNDIPVIVDFWAPWCGPCHAMAPAFERAAGELEPRYRLLKVNTEEEPALAARYGIRSIPTLMLFMGGREIARRAGASDTRGIVSWAKTQLTAKRAATGAN